MPEPGYSWRASYSIETPFGSWYGETGNDLTPTDDYVLVEPPSSPVHDHDGGTALHQAALAGNEDAVREIIRQLKRLEQQLQPLRAHLSARDFDGATPLHLAVRSGSKAVVDLILQSDHNHGSAERLIEANDVFGLTPLHLAIRLAQCRQTSPMTDVISLLVQRGANIHTCSACGRSPLQDAPLDDSVRKILAIGDDEKEPTSAAWNDLRSFFSATFWDLPNVYTRTQALAYLRVWDYCSTTGSSTTRRSLYDDVKAYVVEEVSEVAASARLLPFDDNDESLDGAITLQQFYRRTWKRFKDAAIRRDHAMEPLNRHWVLRTKAEIATEKKRLADLEAGAEEGDPQDIERQKRTSRMNLKMLGDDVYPIKELHWRLWNTHFVQTQEHVQSWLVQALYTDPDLALTI